MLRKKSSLDWEEVLTESVYKTRKFAVEKLDTPLHLKVATTNLKVYFLYLLEILSLAKLLYHLTAPPVRQQATRAVHEVPPQDRYTTLLDKPHLTESMRGC
jgi:hypothetical protein